MKSILLRDDWNSLSSNSPEFGRGCGGKGTQLLQLKQQGFNVPSFLILPWGQVKKIIEPIYPRIVEYLTSIETSNNNSIIEAANGISKLFDTVELAPNVNREIMHACKKQFGSGYSVSVRSSALEEDGVNYSFAGQLDSFLYVGEEHLIQNVVSCIASLYSARVIKYRLQHGLDSADGMAVIIQNMVNAEKSGVLFTVNSMGNMNESVLVAAYGVGEGVVSDRADVDTYYVERGKSSVISVIAEKRTYLDQSEVGSGVIEKTLGHELQSLPVLSDLQAQEVVALGLQLEAINQKAQDVEFAFDGSGELYLLQARPITGAAIGEVKVLDNSNIVESYPGVTLPLSFDFALNAYCGVFTSAARLFNLPEALIETHGDAFSNLLCRVNGRIYYQLHNARRLLEHVLVSRSSQLAWREFIGIKGLEWPIVKPKIGAQVRALSLFVKLFFNHRHSMDEVFKAFHRHHGLMSTFIAGLDNKSTSEIFSFYQSGAKKLSEDWAPTILNDYFALKIHSLYRTNIVAMGFDEEGLENDLLCGIEGMESEHALIRLLEIKEIVSSSTRLSNLFTGEPFFIWQSLEHFHSLGLNEDDVSVEAWPLILKLHDYLDCFGDRVLEELKLETPSLRLQPWTLISMIQNQLTSSASVASFKRRQQDIRGRAEGVVASRLKYSPIRKRLFNFLLSRARLAVKDRENMRLNRARIYGLVKVMFLEIGKRMVKDGLIDAAEDIFYLKLIDLQRYCLEHQRDTYKGKVEDEKQKVEHYADLNLPDRLVFTGSIPDLSHYNSRPPVVSCSQLKGLGASKGMVTGCARVIDQASMSLNIKGEILVTRMTDPGWVFLIAQSAGLISEKGSLLSHTAIVGREFGIPTVVGVENATQLITSGNQIKMNGDLGEVEILVQSSSLNKALIASDENHTP